MIRTFTYATAAILTLVLSGCGSERPKPGSVAKEWAENTRNLGIIPIYPPRERVYPGDIYISAIFDYVTIEDGAEYLYTITPFRYDHLDLQQEFKNEAADTRLMPAMASYTNGGNSTTPWAMPKHGVNGGRLNGLIAFPGFTFASMKEFTVGANITNGAWGALFGGSRTTEYLVSYSVPAAEYISLELRPLLQNIRSYRAKITASQVKDIRDLGRSLQKAYVGDTPPIMAIIIPSEVYYARSIDVTISSADGTGVQFSAVTMAMVELSARKQKLQDQLVSIGELGPPQNTQDKPENGAKPPKPDVKPASPDSSEKPGNDTDGNTENITATSLRTQISSIQTEIATLAKSAIPSAPGVTGSVSASNANGVTLTQTFYYPIAVGYKGLTYRLNAFAALPKPGNSPKAAATETDGAIDDSEGGLISRDPRFLKGRETTKKIDMDDCNAKYQHIPC
jgi:hypothetical protein